MFGRKTGPHAGYAAICSDEAEAMRAENDSVLRGTASGVSDAACAGKALHSADIPPALPSRVLFCHEVMSCVRKLEAWKPEGGALLVLYRAALTGQDYALSDRELTPAWRQFAANLKNEVATYEQDWNRLTGLSRNMIHAFDWIQTEPLEDRFDLLLQRQLAVAHRKFKDARRAFEAGDVRSACRADHQGRQYCWFADAILRCAREGTEAQKDELQQMLAEGMQKGNVPKMYQQLKSSCWYAQAPAAEPLTDDPFAEMAAAGPAPDTAASSPTWSPPCTPTGTLTRMASHTAAAPRTVRERIEDLLAIARLRFTQIDRSRQLSQRLSLLHAELPGPRELPSQGYLAALDQLERDVATAQRVSAVQQEAVLAEIALRNFLASRPALDEMLHYRKDGAKSAYQASLQYASEGRMDRAETAARDSFNLNNLALQMARSTEAGTWPDAAAQIRQRDALCLEAHAQASGPVTVTMARLLDRVVALRNGFDTAVNQEQAAVMLDRMERTLAQVKALGRVPPHPRTAPASTPAAPASA